MRRMQTFGGLAAALVLAFGLPSPAAIARGSDVAAVQNADAEAEDDALLTEAFEAMSAGGYAALDPLLPRLRAALDRMPASYPFVSVDGDVATVRTDDFMTYLMTSAMLQKDGDGQASTVVQKPNVYPMIALVLASEAVERGRFEEAIAYTDRGLAAQPGEPQLTIERGVALHGAGRAEEALANIDAALEGNDVRAMFMRRPMLRQRGFLLIELGRLDEAEAAYREVLENDPDNAIALGQIEYIESQRAGAPRGEVVYEAPAADSGD